MREKIRSYIEARNKQITKKSKEGCGVKRHLETLVVKEKNDVLRVPSGEAVKGLALWGSDRLSHPELSSSSNDTAS